MFLKYFRKFNLIGYVLSFLFMILALHLFLNEGNKVEAILAVGISYLSLLVSQILDEEKEKQKEVIKLLEDVKTGSATNGYQCSSCQVWNNSEDTYTLDDGEEI